MLAKACIQFAVDVLCGGGIVAYPTEGVYGLGCDPARADTVLRLCKLKQRPVRAGLILIAAQLEQLAGWIDPTEQELQRLLEPSVEPTTWIVTAHARAGHWITGYRPRIAVRITSHPLARALCNGAGMALVSTSANRRGRRPALHSLQVRHWFGDQIDLLVPGPTGGLSAPTLIRDARSGVLLRGV